MREGDLRALPDRTPPMNLEAEYSVLGAVLLDPHIWPEIRRRLEPEDFYRPANQVIFRAMVELADLDAAPDVSSVIGALSSSGHLDDAGGERWVRGLVERVSDNANVRFHADIVREKAKLRAYLGMAREVERRILEGCYTAEEIAGFIVEQTTAIDQAGRALDPGPITAVP